MRFECRVVSVTDDLFRGRISTTEEAESDLGCSVHKQGSYSDRCSTSGMARCGNWTGFVLWSHRHYLDTDVHTSKVSARMHYNVKQVRIHVGDEGMFNHYHLYDDVDGLLSATQQDLWWMRRKESWM